MLKSATRILIGTGVVAALWAGCTIKEVDPGTPIETTSNGAGPATSSVGAGGSGTGTAGQGGATSGNTTSTGPSGTGGGVNACTGEQAASSDPCTMMNISPEQGGYQQCDGLGGISGSENGPGYEACFGAFDLWTAAAFADFQACLALIDSSPSSTCDPDIVSDCVTQAYDNACDRPEVATLCDQFAADCSGAGQSFDAQGCKDDLRPFSDNGINIYGECMAALDPGIPCQDAHDQCFDTIQQ